MRSTRHAASLWRRTAFGGLAALLCVAADPPPSALSLPGTPPSEAAPRRIADNEAIADQFTMLAFDGDPAATAGPRERLARWQQPVSFMALGTDGDMRLASATASILSKYTGVSIALAPDGAPNLLVVVNDDPVSAFAGPLRRLLVTAFNGDEPGVDAFIGQVVTVERCWVIAVWGDSEQTIIKAAVVGIDARQPRAAVERCMAQKLAGALGLLGPFGYLPRSVFSPQSGATRYSLEDGLMLRLLYSTAMRPGMTRAEAHAAALAALPGLRHR